MKNKIWLIYEGSSVYYTYKLFRWWLKTDFLRDLFTLTWKDGMEFDEYVFTWVETVSTRKPVDVGRDVCILVGFF